MNKLSKFIIKITDRQAKWATSIKNLKWYQRLVYFVCIIELFVLMVLVLAILKTSSWVFFVLLAVVFVLLRGKFWINNRFVKKVTKGNIFIFGAKGSGKDMIMQLSVIKLYKGWLNRKRLKYLANDDYGYGGIVTEPKEIFDLSPNTYKNLVENKIIIIPKNHDLEGRHYYLTDSAIYFPSQEDTALNKQYPSFPIFYATSRHLYDMSITVNTQVNGRLWVKLREQVQDGYIEALSCIGWGWFMSSIPVIRDYTFTHIRYYSKLASAEMGLLPFRKIAVLNVIMDKTVYMTTAGATKEQYEAMYGKIFDMVCLVKKSHVSYDTRIFHEKFFGYKAGSLAELESKKKWEQFKTLKKSVMDELKKVDVRPVEIDNNE